MKLLLLYLKKQISKHIEAKVLAKKAAQHQQQGPKNKQRQAAGSRGAAQPRDRALFSRPKNRHSPVLQMAGDQPPCGKFPGGGGRSGGRASASPSPELICQQPVYPQAWRPAQGRSPDASSSPEKSGRKLTANPVRFAKGPQVQVQPASPQGIEQLNLPNRFALSQYMEFIKDTWRTQLDPEGKQEVSEGKFFKFLRENKILAEKKQMEDMLKQCLYLQKGHEVPRSSTVPWTLFQKMFCKPLLLIGMENALALIEQHGPPADADHVTIKPEEDVSSIGQTLAVVGFHRKYMRQVFSSEEHGQFRILKKEQRKERKMRRVQLGGLEDGGAASPKGKAGLYEQLAAIMDKQKDGSVAKELGRKPFGIDQEEAIKIMSVYAEKEREKGGKTKAEMGRKLEREMMEAQQKQRSEAIREKAKLRAQGIAVSETESESTKTED